MRQLLFHFLLSIFPLSLFSQAIPTAPNASVENPITPTAFQFLKFGEYPVNEYNGIPDISIPLYTIEAGVVKFPIVLRYHAGGIKIAEEASWVGLGWDLSFGSVTQIVNDRDDLDSFSKQLPDYFNDHYPNYYPMRWNYPWMTIPWGGARPHNNNGIPIDAPEHSVMIFSDYYVPINDDFDTRREALFKGAGDIGDNIIDSEPDIFKADFNGHHLEFVVDYNDYTNGKAVVLNQRGYKIDKTTLPNGTLEWNITAPDGVIYCFAATEEVHSEWYLSMFEGVTCNKSEDALISRTWHLTKITGYDQREVLFTYTGTNDIYDFPSFSQRYHYMIPDNYHEFGSCFYDYIYFNFHRYLFQYPNVAVEDLSYSSTVCNHHKRLYVSNISFPSGNISFHQSDDRTDILNERKLEAIDITNSLGQTIKRYSFSFEYFQGINTGAGFDSVIPLWTIQKEPVEYVTRLKLVNLTESGSPPYIFTYDEIPLPSKCSFAVDYWGYYNGKTTNGSLIPNPVDLGLTNPPANSNDHKAYLKYSQAGTLMSMKYPTGGITYFEYELNEFDAFNNSNTHEGNGIRIRTIINKDGESVVKSVKYSYEDGLLMNPLLFHSGYSFDVFEVISQEHGIYRTKLVDCQVLLSSSHFTTSMLGSGNGVGYSKVKKEYLDSQGQSNGKTVKHYSNHSDLCDQVPKDLSLPMPSRRDHKYPLNGSLLREEIWNKENSNWPDKITENEYYPFYIPYAYYGARVASHRYFHATAMDLITNQCPLYTYEQNYVGYFPIYSGWSLLKKSTVMEQQLSGPPLSNSHFFYYDEKNNISSTRATGSDGTSIDETYYYPYSEIIGGTGMADLVFQNRINHSVLIENEVSTPEFGISTIIESYNHFQFKPPLSGYQTWMNIHSTSLRSDDPNIMPAQQKLIFDDYDNYGNILQYHKEHGLKTSILWGYENMNQVVKGENINYSDLNAAVYAASAYACSGNFDSLLSLIGDLTTEEHKITWSKFNENLREKQVGSQVLITTYSYAPLIGITSMTDPSGITTYYEYDTRGRLLLSRDYAGNVLQKFEYHYLKLPN